MEIIVKRFNELSTSELYDILRCRAEVFVMGQKCIYLDMDGIDFFSTHLYITENGNIISYLRIIDPGIKFPAASIGRVLTMPEYRRQGYGRILVKVAIKIVGESSDVIEIEAQSYLRDFYKSFGFVEISEEFMLENIPHIRMVLRL